MGQADGEMKSYLVSFVNRWEPNEKQVKVTPLRVEDVVVAEIEEKEDVVAEMEVVTEEEEVAEASESSSAVRTALRRGA